MVSFFIALGFGAPKASAQEASEAIIQTRLIDPLGFEIAEPSAAPQARFQRNPVLSAVHLGLGYATVAVGLATGIFNPEVAGEDVHESLGYASAALSGATMVFGYLAHHGEVGPGFRWSSNNIHAALGIAGGSMMMIAPFLAPSDAHKLVGVAGALSMGLSVAWKIMY
jgi:hypothetical protein